MGTRADFYVGRLGQAGLADSKPVEWLGSIGGNGHPDGITAGVLLAGNEDAFRFAVDEMVNNRPDGTIPEQGWPWPWEDSQTTDYAYAFDLLDPAAPNGPGMVYVSIFGRPWFPVRDTLGQINFNPPVGEEAYFNQPKSARFPDMTAVQNVTFGPRSGLTIVAGGTVVHDLPPATPEKIYRINIELTSSSFSIRRKQRDTDANLWPDVGPGPDDF